MKRIKRPVLDVMAASVEVYNRQGFIRSGMGYVQPSTDENQEDVIFNDNKTSIIELLENDHQFTLENYARAQKIIDDLNGKMMLKKMTGNLSNFDNNIIKIFSDMEDTNNFGVSIIASLPHSIDIDRKRERVNDRMAQLKHSSQYMGEIKARYDIDIEILDCKFIQTSAVYMITGVYAGKDIIKFWWRDQPDLSDMIEGRKVKIRGTISKHENSKYSNAKETMMNRVKIVEVIV
jgi:hypothetical protein